MAAQPLAPIDVVGPGYRGVILAPKPGGWMPTPQQVAALESRLPKAMRERAPEFHEPLRGYFRQYIGTFADRRRWIEVRGVSPELMEILEADGLNPRMKEWQVYDGGDSIFGALYDPATDTFDRAGPGGEA